MAQPLYFNVDWLLTKPLSLEKMTRFWADNRDFKIQRRGRQRERKKNNWFNQQNNYFARASHFFIHFFPVFARRRPENN